MTIPCFCGRYRMLPLCSIKSATPTDADETCKYCRTRRPTNYGSDFCSGLVDDIGSYFPETVIVSGLAYGIDSVSHSSALERSSYGGRGCPRAGSVYPAAHRDLAGRIVRSGGAIVSEYPSGTRIFQGNFLEAQQDCSRSFTCHGCC